MPGIELRVNQSLGETIARRVVHDEIEHQLEAALAIMERGRFTANPRLGRSRGSRGNIAALCSLSTCYARPAAHSFSSSTPGHNLCTLAGISRETGQGAIGPWS